MKFEPEGNPNIHIQEVPHKQRAIAVGIIFPVINLRFDITPEEVTKLVNDMAVAAFKEIKKTNETEIVQP